MAIGDVFAVQYKLLVNDRSTSWILYYIQKTGTDEPTLALNLGIAVNLAIGTALRNMLSLNCRIMCTYVRRVLPTPSIPFEGNLIEDVGTRSGEMLPPNSAFVVRFSSSDTDLGNSGRIFLAGVSKLDTIDGAMAATFLAAEANAFEAALALTVTVPSITGDFDIGILSKVKAGAPRVPWKFFDADAIAVLPTVYSQKRRRSKRTDFAASLPG